MHNGFYNSFMFFVIYICRTSEPELSAQELQSCVTKPVPPTLYCVVNPIFRYVAKISLLVHVTQKKIVNSILSFDGPDFVNTVALDLMLPNTVDV
jgi:hypothetical protein